MKPPFVSAWLNIGHDGTGKLVAQLVFWCEHCKRPHYHGMPPGHRVSHCLNEKSPYKQTGYYLTYTDLLPKIGMTGKQIAAFLKRRA
jgi:hypothetical protein